LNDCVTALLKKPKSDAEYGREIKKRHRKNQDQVKFLENEYLKSQNWSRDFIKELATKLELKDHQVYKWWWDTMKKKDPSV